MRNALITLLVLLSLGCDKPELPDSPEGRFRPEVASVVAGKKVHINFEWFTGDGAKFALRQALAREQCDIVDRRRDADIEVVVRLDHNYRNLYEAYTQAYLCLEVIATGREYKGDSGREKYDPSRDTRDDAFKLVTVLAINNTR